MNESGSPTNDHHVGSFRRTDIVVNRATPLASESVANDARIVYPADQVSNGSRLLDYWRVVWKRKFVVGACVLACIAIAIAATLLTTPIYTASSTIQIDREASKVVNLQDVTPREDAGQTDEFYQTQYGLLRSKALIERVVDTLELQDSSQYLRTVGLDRSPLRRATSQLGLRMFREDIIRRLSGAFSVQPVRGSRLVTLSFDSPDPAVASWITNNFASSFIAENLQRRFDSSAYARDFLEQQLAIAKTKLDDSEKAAVAYAVQQQIIDVHDDPTPTSNGVSTSNDGESLTDKNLSALDTAYAAAKTARIEAQSKWIQAQQTPGLGLPEIQQNPVIQELSQQRALLQSQYEDQGRLYRPGYPAMQQLKSQIDELDKRIADEASTIKQTVFSAYKAALTEEQSLENQVNQLKGNELDLMNKRNQYNFLLREADTNRQLYDGLLQRYKEVGVTGGVQANNIAIVERAEPPLLPSKPRPVLNVAIGVLLGLGGGALLAFALEALDNTVRSPAEVEERFGLPVLGAVPLLKNGITPEEAMSNLRSPFSEAYQAIRAALQLSSAVGIPRSLLIVSARPGEGKTTTSIALSNHLARLGGRVLLVDGDLRKPSLHKRFGVANNRGLANYLSSGAAFEELFQTTEQPGLFLVTSGSLPPSPAELLADQRLQVFLANAAAEFDFIVVDGPPVMGFADAPMIASAVAGTVLVVEAGMTGRAQVGAALRRLRMARARIVGVVLAKLDARKAPYGYGAGYGYYAYDYDYGDRKPDTKAVE
jgi:capsular exopolysaccharide synthesis family protein